MKFLTLMLACISVCACVLAEAAEESGVSIHVEKTVASTWLVTYSTQTPTTQLSFIRNPDNSRVARWQPVDAAFEIVRLNRQEYLRRKDGSTFSFASVQLTPTYKHLPKDYAPFSPFSDGGMLFHTGRLFACANICLDDTNRWQLSVSVPPGEHVIVNGLLQTEAVSWLDSNDGQNVYVGTQMPIETDNVIAVIDTGLPQNLKKSLSSTIPTLMNYFESRLGGHIGQKPTLFASYANIKGGSTQGGTLPGQIFMHWNRNDLEQKTADERFLTSTLWFFAHEVAHWFQGGSQVQLFGEQNESWLHEGHAEWLAALALKELYPDSSDYVDDKIMKLQEQCEQGLAEVALVNAAEQGHFDLYYSCGLLIHRAIDQVLRANNQGDTFTLWRAFVKAVLNGEKPGTDTFLTLTKPLTSEAIIALIEAIVFTKLTEPHDTLEQLSQPCLFIVCAAQVN